MGNRANIVVVEHHDWQLYYSHWAGGRIIDALIGGPDLALRYARSLRPCVRSEWVDPVWADGGAVIDLDRRRLLFFGDELMVEMPQRRALLTVLAELWPGYEVGWAYDGTIELAGYVGAPLHECTWDKRLTLRLARDRNTLCHLVSVVNAAGDLRMWPLWWNLGKAWLGPELLGALPGRGVTRLVLNKIPEGGVHIDVNRNTMGMANSGHHGHFPTIARSVARMADGVLGRPFRGTGGALPGFVASSRPRCGRRYQQRTAPYP
jgi:hypothetical protein